MLCVLGALLYLYLSAGVSLVSTWKEARGDSASWRCWSASTPRWRPARLPHQPGDALPEARRLGMIRPGEQTT